MSPTHAPTAEPSEAAPAEAVAPLMRGLTVLRRLTDADGALSLADLERATGLARSTLDRVVGTLARMGYVRLDGRTVLLAPRLTELGNAYLAALRLPALLGPAARVLADELDESVSLAVPDGAGIRFIHQTTRRRTMSVSFRIGDLLPAERTAPGALFAARWDEEAWARWRERRAADPAEEGFPALPPRRLSERPSDVEFTAAVRLAAERGWALDDQLIEPGLIALAVPVHGPDGGVVCAASVVSHTSRHSAGSLRERLLPRLRATVEAMERELRRAPAGGGQATGPSGLAAWTGASKQELGRTFNESLARGLTVLTAFGEGRGALTLTAVAEATGLARATARRALITFEHLGYVVQDGRVFRLTPRVLALGFPPLSRTTLSRIAAPHLAALTERLHDSSSLAVLDGDDVRYTARAAARRIMTADITVGTRFPAYATSMGRVLLAGLPPAERAARLARTGLAPLTPHTVTDPGELAVLLHRVRQDGYALVDEELEVGLRSIAVPVHDRAGTVVAAVNVAMHASHRTPRECVAEVLPELRAEAARIEADLHLAGRFTDVPAV
ncbi:MULTISPECIES: IclR family transcriptional regulator domain-containing protein [unclassified Streptomyces]|uniref:IclR family transcriptional regulator domain-containing protein n=1 Tax=unclassified Streptomyces TaxID=2593676 RepID=UPI00093EDD21|nr:IclR family transcriptional regulator C-terminal domain-containing protein [Streptomyces sp. TSRI0107]OKJ81327.1 IclR family transcriptional regulator [Streptomyces sp. TSRI0107]